MRIDEEHHRMRISLYLYLYLYISRVLLVCTCLLDARDRRPGRVARVVARRELPDDASSSMNSSCSYQYSSEFTRLVRAYRVHNYYNLFFFINHHLYFQLHIYIKYCIYEYSILIYSLPSDFTCKLSLLVYLRTFINRGVFYSYSNSL